jgi:hypothetical protein
VLLGNVQPLSCLRRSRAGPRGLTRAGAGRLQAVSGERPQTLSAGERMSRCPGSVRRSLACIVGSLSVKIKWLHAVWRRSPKTDAHSPASRITHSIEGWRTGELGADTLPGEPEGWQRAMPCASG